MINIKKFTEEWLKIEQQLHEIAKITDNDNVGDNFNDISIDIEHEIFTYITDTYFSRGGYETYRFEVKFNEINNPIEWFQEKYRKEQEDYDNKLAEKDKNAAIRQEQEDYDKFLELQAKFMNK